MFSLVTALWCSSEDGSASVDMLPFDPQQTHPVNPLTLSTREADVEGHMDLSGPVLLTGAGTSMVHVRSLEVNVRHRIKSVTPRGPLILPRMLSHLDEVSFISECNDLGGAAKVPGGRFSEGPA